MVKELKKGNQTFYLCEVCGLAYRERKWAEKCQQWCETHHGSCSVDYSRHAAELEPESHQQPD